MYFRISYCVILIDTYAQNTETNIQKSHNTHHAYFNYFFPRFLSKLYYFAVCFSYFSQFHILISIFFHVGIL